MFATILAILQAIPVLNDWFKKFVLWYTQQEIANLNKDIRDGLRKVLLEQDQRDLEKAIGSPDAGKVSGIAGTELRDSLPGVFIPK